jgi:phage-related tail fiber protein
MTSINITANLPGYLNDIVEVATFADLPVTGSTQYTYKTIDTGRLYNYVPGVGYEDSADVVSSDAVPEGATNLYFTQARVRDTVLVGFTPGTVAAIAATDSVFEAFRKLQAQLNSHFGAGGSAHALASGAQAGFMSTSHYVKLDGIAAEATKNQTDAFLLSRTNHTGEQPISTVTGLQAALDSKEPNLGFIPVQQGTGAGQSPAIAVKIGWNPTSARLELATNSTEYGSVWPMSVSGNALTATRLETARTLSVGGDATGGISFNGTTNVTIPVTLVNTGVVTGTYTKVTVDAKGRVTTATTLSATDIPNLDWSKITTGKPTTRDGYGITDVPKNDGTSATGTWAISISGSAATLTTARTISITGDGTASGSFNGSANLGLAFTLANSGATAGSYGTSIAVPTVTVDAKGRITAVSNTTIRSATTSQTGVVQLNNTVTSTSTTEAATTNAVKVTYDYAATMIPLAQRGVANGVATLDAQGLVPSSQLPSYVDDILEYPNLAAFPATGETGKIYVALDDNRQYRWSGSVYIWINENSGTADAAVKLQTARTINGTSFDGTANITTLTWGTARNITIGLLTRSVNGSADVEFTLADIGAFPKAGGTIDGNVDVGATNRAANTVVRALAGDAHRAGFEAHGDVQGTGYVYVGQSTTFGGGMFYNGDASPAFATGEAADRVSFFRRADGVAHVVFSYFVTGPDVLFVGNITAPTFIGALTGNASTATKLATARTLSITGDATWSTTYDGSANSTGALTLSNSGVVAGTYPKVTVDAKGRVTNGSSLVAADIPSLDWSKITTGKPSTLAGYGISDGALLDGSNAVGTWGISVTGNAGTATTLQTSRTISTTGDGTWTVDFNGSANVSAAFTLANSGVTAGTFGNNVTIPTVTVDAKGRVTSIAHNSVRLGTTSQTGLVQLNDNLTSTSTTLALTANQGKVLRDTTPHAARTSGTLNTTSGTWYRVASSPVGVDRCTGEFWVRWSISSHHGSVRFDSSIYYGLEPTAIQKDFSRFGSGGFDAVRVVYHTTYAGNYAFVELRASGTHTAIQMDVQSSSMLGWSLTPVGTLGSIPAGYSTYQANFYLKITSGTYPKVTVDNYGRVTGGTTLVAADIPALDWSKITTGKPTTLAGYGITDAASSTHNHTLDSLSNVTVTSPIDGQVLTRSGTGWVNTTLDSINTGTATKLATARTISITGDGTWSVLFDGSGNVTSALTLSNSGVTAATYGSTIGVPVIVVDAKGRITSASTQTIRSASTAQTGVVQLNNTVTSTSTTEAATASAVKAAYDSSLTKIPLSEKGAVNGVATLGADGKVPAAQLPSYVDDVLEYATLASFPVTGETSKLYLAIDTGRLYRWSGSAYVWVNPAAGTADTAVKLQTVRSITSTGDVSWTVNFDGSANVSGTATLANSGVTAGTYTKVTVDAKGRVTGGTTLVAADIPTLNQNTTGNAATASQLQRRISTTNSGGTLSGRWTKISTMTITNLYSEMIVLLEGTSVGSGDGILRACEITLRVKQQAAFGSNPFVTAQIVGDESPHFTLGYVVVSNAGPTVVDFYMRWDTTYAQLTAVVIHTDSAGVASYTLYSDQPNFAAGDLTGLVIVDKRVRLLDNDAIALNVNSALTLTNTRTIAITGDGTWSASFNGSANATGALTLANSGVTAGTYRSVTVDAKGRVTAGTNPTTVVGYGLTDAVDITSTQTLTGMKVLAAGLRYGNLSFAKYAWSPAWGAEQTWRTLVTVTLANSAYSAVAWRFKLVDPQNNFGSQTASEFLKTSYYTVSLVRASGTTLNVPDNANVFGPGSQIRVVQTGQGQHEIQVWNDAWHRVYHVESEMIASNGSHTITYGTGLAVGTSTGTIYTAVRGSAREFFERISANVLISEIATGTAPLIVASTTKVANLNVDLLDDQEGSYYTNASNLNTGTVPVARLPVATTSVAGISQLSDSVSTTSSTLSASATAVKQAYDLSSRALRTSSATVNTVVNGWYRLVSSSSGINRFDGILNLRWSVSGDHGVVRVQYSCYFGQNPQVKLLDYGNYSGAVFDKIRIVYHPSYTGNFAYIDVHATEAMTNMSLFVEIVDYNNVASVGIATAAALGSGYLTVEQEISLAALGGDAAGGETFQLISANTTAVSKTVYGVDTTAGIVELTLPATPAVNDTVSFYDAASKFGLNKLVLKRNGQSIMGLVEDVDVNQSGTTSRLVFVGGTTGWMFVGGVLQPSEASTPTVATYTKATAGTRNLTRVAGEGKLYADTRLGNVSIVLDNTFIDQDHVVVYKPFTANRVTFTTTSGTFYLPDGTTDSNPWFESVNGELRVIRDGTDWVVQL